MIIDDAEEAGHRRVEKLAKEITRLTHIPGRNRQLDVADLTQVIHALVIDESVFSMFMTEIMVQDEGWERAKAKMAAAGIG